MKNLLDKIKEAEGQLAMPGFSASTPQKKPHSSAKMSAPTKHEFVEEDVLIEMAKALRLPLDQVESTSSGDDYYDISADGNDYRVVENEDAAIAMAEEQIKEQLNDEPLNYVTMDWLKSFITMSKNDRSSYANDEADARVDGMDDEDALNIAEMMSEYDALRDRYDDRLSKLQDEIDAETDVDKQGVLEATKERLEAEQKKELQKLVDTAHGNAHDYYYNKVYESLSDPYHYFVKEMGMYDDEEFMKQFSNLLDVDEAAESYISDNGWENTLCSYYSESNKTASGFVYWREH